MAKRKGFWRRIFPWAAAKRRFDAAKINRLLNDWVRTSKALDEDLRSGVLALLRARSRDLCTNNDFGKKFLALLAANVVGPKGIRLQSKVKRPPNARGRQVDDGTANARIEQAWAAWGKKENCTVDRKMSFVDVQIAAVKGLARDGEILIRMVEGFDNPFGFALQVMDPEYLDENYIDEKAGIMMGVEKNKWGEPVGYWLLETHPGGGYYTSSAGAHIRIPSGQILHEFLTERAQQTRGVPWTATAMKRLHMLGHYEESELVAARVGAAKMGFFVSPDGTPYGQDDQDGSGNIINEVAPGKFEQLPVGWDFRSFNIDHPSTAFDSFVKTILQAAAAGLNISYASLTNDLSQASYSSTRQGVLEERDFYKMVQGWVAEHLCRPIFERWLPLAIVSGQLNLPIRDLERWNAPVWQGRRWSWVDPQKDMEANIKSVSLGVNSRTRIAMEQGNDFDDILAELQTETEMAAAAGVSVEPKPSSVMSQESGVDKNQS